MPNLVDDWTLDRAPIVVGKGNNGSMTDTVIAFSGLYHLAGQSVVAYIGGLDCGDYTVDSTGMINVPLASDAGGLLTAAYITGTLAGATGANATNIYFNDGSGAAWYSIPVVIGRAYTSRGQLLRPMTEQDVKTPSGPGLGKLRRVFQAAMLLVNTQTPLSIGTGGVAGLTAAKFKDADNMTLIAADTMYSGVYRSALLDVHSGDGMFLWETTRPGPLTVAAISSYYDTVDV